MKNRGKWLFIKAAVKEFKMNGAFLPSSNALSEKMLRPIVFRNGMCIVELGAGTGAFTHLIIERLPSDGKLIVLELNHSLVKHLRDAIKDERVKIIEDDASNLGKYLDSAGQKADYVISGLPLGNMNHGERQKILSAIKSGLKPDGLYVQFQYLLASLGHIKRLFDVKVTSLVLKNFPPAFVYECRKKQG